MELHGMRVDISVRKGKIFSIGDDSGKGKTYMCRLLQLISTSSQYKGEILCLTYEENRTVDSYVGVIESFNGEYIVLDRFELYYHDDIVRALREKQNARILVDIKTNYYAKKARAYPVCILRKGEGVEVSEYADVIRRPS